MTFETFSCSALLHTLQYKTHNTVITSQEYFESMRTTPSVMFVSASLITRLIAPGYSNAAVGRTARSMAHGSTGEATVSRNNIDQDIRSELIDA